MIHVIIKHSDISKNIHKGDHILAYPVRTIFDVLFYKNRVATLAEVMDITEVKNSFRYNLKGMSRALIKKIDWFHFAHYEVIREPVTSEGDRLQIDNLRKKTQELIFLINISESDKLIHLLNYITDINQLTDFISHYFVLKFSGRYRLIREPDAGKRSGILIEMLDRLIMDMRREKK